MIRTGVFTLFGSNVDAIFSKLFNKACLNYISPGSWKCRHCTEPIHMFKRQWMVHCIVYCLAVLSAGNIEYPSELHPTANFYCHLRAGSLSLSIQITIPWTRSFLTHATAENFTSDQSQAVQPGKSQCLTRPSLRACRPSALRVAKGKDVFQLSICFCFILET